MQRDPNSYTDAELIKIGRQVVQRLARSEARADAEASSWTVAEARFARRAERPDAANLNIVVPAFCPGCGLWVTKAPKSDGITLDFEREGLALGN
jgi:hypothetical protein